MKYLSLLLLIAFSLNLSGQENTEPLEIRHRTVHNINPVTEKNPMKLYEDSLVFFADSMYYSGISDFRNAGNVEFIKMMRKVLVRPESFSYPFDTLKQRINILEPSNKSFRIYNWEVQHTDYSYRYYAALQIPDAAGVKFYPLIDVSDQLLRGGEDSVLRNRSWYGALYYNILEFTMNGKPIYFLMGYNGSATNSEKKIVETFYFDKNGDLVFGLPIFPRMSGKGPASRFIYEYQKDSHASLNWNKDLNMIVFDHLESNIGDNAKRYTFVPDGTYDGLQWNGASWMVRPNVVQVVPVTDAPNEVPLNR